MTANRAVRLLAGVLVVGLLSPAVMSAEAESASASEGAAGGAQARLPRLSGQISAAQVMDPVFELVSRNEGGDPIADQAYPLAISADGASVAFHAFDSAYAEPRIYVRDGGVLQSVGPFDDVPVSADVGVFGSTWSGLGMSADGDVLCYMATVDPDPSDPPGTPTADWMRVYVEDLSSGTRELLTSMDSDAPGAWRYVNSTSLAGIGGCSVSADGRYVAYNAYKQVTIGGVPDGSVAVELYDRTTQSTTSVAPATTDGYATVGGGALSADGRYMAYVEGMFAGDIAGATFRRFDRVAGTSTTIRSIDGGQADFFTTPELSPDGSSIFYSLGNRWPDALEVGAAPDNRAGASEDERFDDGLLNLPGPRENELAPRPVSSHLTDVPDATATPSPDGALRAESSLAVGKPRVFSTEIGSGATEDLSSFLGSPSHQALLPQLSPDGGHLGFTIADADSANAAAVVVDLDDGHVQRVAVGPYGSAENSESAFVVPSDDHVFFASDSTNLWGASGSFGAQVYKRSLDHAFAYRPPPLPVDVEAMLGFAKRSSAFLKAVGDIFRVFAVDPVDPVSGNFVHEESDVVFGSGSVIDWSRVYNSRDVSSGVLGVGWSTPADASLDADSGGGAARLRLSDGRVVSFGAAPDGSWVRPFGFDGDLVGDPVVGWSLTMVDGSSMAFDATGRVTGWSDGRGGAASVTWTGAQATSISATDGTGLVLSYDTSGLLSGVAANDGRAVTYGYDGGALASVTLPNGSAVTYGLDGAGRLASIVDGSGVTTLTNTYDSEGRVVAQSLAGQGSATLVYDNVAQETVVTNVETNEATTYRWGTDGEVIEIIDALDATSTRGVNMYGQIASTVDRAGVAATYGYDARGNVVVERSASGGETFMTYDSQDRVVEVLAADGGVITFSYTGGERVPSSITDPEGGVVTQTVTDGLVTQRIDGDGVVTAFTYDNARQLTSVTDGVGGVTLFDYDAAGRLIRQESPEGAVQEWAYDANGWLLAETAPDGGETTYTHDEAGRVLTVMDPAGAVTTNAYDTAGRLATTTDPVGGVTTYTYDDLGQVLTVTEPGGATTTNVWGPLGRLVSSTDPEGVTTSYDYDAAGRQVAVTTPAGTAQTRFDAAGRVAEQEDPLGRITTFTYDVMDRLASTADPAGGVIAHSYDLAGRQVTMTNAVGGVTTTGYTPGGRIASVTDPVGVTTSYRYDAAGRQVGVSDDAGHETVTVLDGDGRPLSVTSPEGRSRTYTYDPAGRPLTETDGAGVVTTRSWSTRGELLGEQVTGQGAVTYTYDPFGRVATVTDALGGVTEYTYDGRGNRLTRTDPLDNVWSWTWDLADRPVTESDPDGGTTTYSYDAAGRVATVTDPTGRVATNQWDAADQLTSIDHGGGVTVGYTYDPAGRRATMIDATGTTTWSWDLAGRLAGVTTGDGDTVTYGYDVSGRRTSIAYPDASSLGYGYDDRGLLDALDAGPLGTTTYDWDRDGRLVVEDLPGVDYRAWDYDDGGRPDVYFDQTDGVTEFMYRGYDASGRPSGDAWTDGRIAFYAYDAAGQLTAAGSTARGTQHWTYDANGRRNGECHNSVCWNHIYDASGRRTSTVPAFTSNSYATEVTQDNPAGWWRLGDVAGTIAQDATAGGNDGAYSAGIALDQAGAIADDPDGAVTLDGTGAVTLPTPTASLTTGDSTTVEFWFRPTNDSFTVLAAFGDYWLMRSDGEIGFGSGDGGFFAGRSPARTGDWTHVVAQFVNGEVDQSKLWIDGQPIALRETGQPTGIGTVSGSLAIGAFQSTPPLFGLVGDVDEVSVYNGVLTDARIASHYQAGAGGMTYDHDAAGRLTSQITTHTERTTSYDATGAIAGLTETSHGETATQQRSYDGDQRLASITTTMPGGSPMPVDVTWDVALGVPETVELGSEPIVHGPAGPLVRNGTHQARDINASVVDDVPFGYDAWGDSLAPAPLDQTGLGYRGEPTFGHLTHLRARDYDAASGAFTTPDPLDGVNGTPVVANPYHYANNSPLAMMDPLGLRATDAVLNAECAATAAVALAPPAGPMPTRESYLHTEQMNRCFPPVRLPSNCYGGLGQSVADVAYGILRGLTLGQQDALVDQAKVCRQSPLVDIGTIGGAQLSGGFLTRALRQVAAVLRPTTQALPSPAQAANLVRSANPVGSALKGDIYHRSATWAVDDIASNGSVYRLVGNGGVQRTLIQAPGELNGIAGRFEWIVDDAGNLTHQMFVKGGSINGVPITP